MPVGNQELKMPILRCPTCYYATTIRQDSIAGIECGKCGTNLFDYYYKGRSIEEAALLISEKGTEFKKRKAKAERDAKKQNASQARSHRYNPYSTSTRNVAPEKETVTERVIGYVIAGVIVLAIYGGIQYSYLRSEVQETTIEMLNDNGYLGYQADGITLPLSAAFGGIVTAKVFLLDESGKTKAIEVEVTQKGIPIFSVFTGSSFYTAISGIELMQLK